MGRRTEERKRILREAHEGHTSYQPEIRVKRVGPRKWMTRTEYGYDYLETILNWKPSMKQALGLLITLIGLIGILLAVLWLAHSSG